MYLYFSTSILPRIHLYFQFFVPSNRCGMRGANIQGSFPSVSRSIYQYQRYM